MICVMRSRTGFRVILNDNNGLVTVGNRRNGAVVQIEMGDINDVGIQRFCREGKPMVLTCDLNMPRGATGVIQTAMAIGQLERFAAKGQAKDLMPQTDPEQR